MKPLVRKIIRNRTNKKVEINISEILDNLLETGLSRADIARHAGVSQTTVSTWGRRKRADAAAVDRLIQNVSATQSEKSLVAGGKSDSELWHHIKAIEALGFEVILKPIRPK